MLWCCMLIVHAAAIPMVCVCLSIDSSLASFYSFLHSCSPSMAIANHSPYSYFHACIHGCHVIVSLFFFPRSFNELYWLLHSCTHPFYSLSLINSFVCSADSSDDPMNRCKAASTHWTALPRALVMCWEVWPCRSCGTWAVSVLEEIWNYSIYTFFVYSVYFWFVEVFFCCGSTFLLVNALEDLSFWRKTSVRISVRCAGMLVFGSWAAFAKNRWRTLVIATWKSYERTLMSWNFGFVETFGWIWVVFIIFY